MLLDELPSRADAVATPWKSIDLGTFADKAKLQEALRDGAFHLSECAKAMLALPDFKLESRRYRCELYALSLRQLGITSGEKLGRIYQRAFRMGFALCPAEIGPQLRLQYPRQPKFEFLRIAMAPIEQYRTEEIFGVGHTENGMSLECCTGSVRHFIYSADVRLVFKKA